jgi:ribosomal protein S27AE
MEHQHGPNCGCKDILGIETASDLLASIDVDRVRTLNEESNRCGGALFREHDLRFQKQDFIASDSDGELLLIVPFLAQVKIRSICVIALDLESAPLQMRLYVNN